MPDTREPIQFSTIITADQPHRRYVRDLIGYRELFGFLAWRDILVRYKQTVIGVAWSVIRPLVTMVVFTGVFSGIAGLPSGNLPYPVLVYAALLPWQLFANAFSESANSLLENARVFTKVYFPRLIMPVSAILVSLIDFAISLAILLVLMAVFRMMPDWRILVMPVFLVMVLVVATGAGVWVSALNVKYRDFRYIIPFILQVGLYVSPIGFSSSLMPSALRFWYYLNPMAGAVDGFRWCFSAGASMLYLPGLALSGMTALLILWGGISYFRRTEDFFADLV